MSNRLRAAHGWRSTGRINRTAGRRRDDDALPDRETTSARTDARRRIGARPRASIRLRGAERSGYRRLASGRHRCLGAGCTVNLSKASIRRLRAGVVPDWEIERLSVSYAQIGRTLATQL